jgi:hypothetical protein
VSGRPAKGLPDSDDESVPEKGQLLASRWTSSWIVVRWDLLGGYRQELVILAEPTGTGSG